MTPPSTPKIVSTLPEKLVEVYNKYKGMRDEVKDMEDTLKKGINGAAMVGRKTIGWVPTNSKRVNLQRVHDKVGNEIFRHLTVNSYKSGGFYAMVKELNDPGLYDETRSVSWKL